MLLFMLSLVLLTACGPDDPERVPERIKESCQREFGAQGQRSVDNCVRDLVLKGQRRSRHKTAGGIRNEPRSNAGKEEKETVSLDYDQTAIQAYTKRVSAWAIREGRQAAHAVDSLLMGSSVLPR
jgi:NADPH-dependent glutamate synthase beta subunit-like oxidoreductase